MDVPVVGYVMARMTAVNDWRFEPQESFTHLGIYVYSGTAKQDGRTWPDMAYRVSVKGKRVRTFLGECAWSDAARYASDQRLEKHQVRGA